MADGRLPIGLRLADLLVSFFLGFQLLGLTGLACSQSRSGGLAVRQKLLKLMLLVLQGGGCG